MALKEQLSPTNKLGQHDGMSCNYKRDFPFGSIQGNIIWNGRSPVAREVMLKTALKAFDYNFDLFEVQKLNIVIYVKHIIYKIFKHS